MAGVMSRLSMNLKERVAYVKERGRINKEIAAYTDASRNKNRFTEYYKLRISYLERLLTELENKYA